MSHTKHALYSTLYLPFIFITHTREIEYVRMGTLVTTLHFHVTYKAAVSLCLRSHLVTTLHFHVTYKITKIRIERLHL